MFLLFVSVVVVLMTLATGDDGGGGGGVVAATACVAFFRECHDGTSHSCHHLQYSVGSVVAR